MCIIVLNAGHLLNDSAVRPFSLIFQRDVAKMQQHDLHRAGICEDNDLSRGLSLSKESIDFCLDPGIFAVWLLICITEYQDNLIAVILKFIFGNGPEYLTRSLH